MGLQLFCVFSLFASALSQRPPWEQIGSNIGPIEHESQCELLILPSTMVEINEGETVRLHCRASCGDLRKTLRWEDNTGSRVPEVQPLSETFGARFWLSFLRLDIGGVGPQHEGNYFCKGRLAGNWIIRSTYLKIKPRYPPTPTPTSTTTTTTTTTTPLPTTTTSTTTTSTAPPTTSTISTTSTTISTTTITTPESTTTTEITTVTSPESSSLISVSSTHSSEDIASSSSSVQGLPSEEDSFLNNEIDAVSQPTSMAVGVADGVSTTVESSPMPSAPLPNPSSSGSSSTHQVMENSSAWGTSLTASSDESPSSALSSETPISGTTVSDSGTPSAESLLATSTDLSNGSSEAQPGESAAPTYADNARGVPSTLAETDLVGSDINVEENIRPEIINESVNVNSDVVNIIPDIAALHVARRKKRDSYGQDSKQDRLTMATLGQSNGTAGPSFNGSAIFNDGIYACTGFGSSAVATIAILGAFCLIFIYAFILVLCLPRVRRRKTLQISEKEMEEGGEGIEIREKAGGPAADPNGRISHGEDAVTMVDINNTEANEDAAAAASPSEDKNKESAPEVGGEEPNIPEKKQPKETIEELKTENETDKVTEPKDVATPLMPPPTPPMPYMEPVRQKEDAVDPVELQSEAEGKQEDPAEAAPSSLAAPKVEEEEEEEEKEEVVSPEQHIPVFEEPEPQEMIVKESVVNGANVELEDKSVDTVELESQDIEEPGDYTPGGRNQPADTFQQPDALQDDRVSPAPVFDRGYPEVKTSPPTNERLSNGFDNPDYNEHHLAPERDEMTKSIEDLPPPPPIPAHRPAQPAPTPGADDTGMEAPDVVSSNITAV